MFNKIKSEQVIVV